MKKMLALVLSLVMVFGLVGCGKNAGGSDNDGSTKLTVWYWGEQEIPGYKQYMEEMAQKYSSETDGINVEVVLQESDTLYSALRTAEQAGEGPDLAFLWGRNAGSGRCLAGEPGAYLRLYDGGGAVLHDCQCPVRNQLGRQAVGLPRIQRLLRHCL